MSVGYLIGSVVGQLVVSLLLIGALTAAVIVIIELTRGTEVGAALRHARSAHATALVPLLAAAPLAVAFWLDTSEGTTAPAPPAVATTPNHGAEPGPSAGPTAQPDGPPPEHDVAACAAGAGMVHLGVDIPEDQLEEHDFGPRFRAEAERLRIIAELATDLGIRTQATRAVEHYDAMGELYPADPAAATEQGGLMLDELYDLLDECDRFERQHGVVPATVS